MTARSAAGPADDAVLAAWAEAFEARPAALLAELEAVRAEAMQRFLDLGFPGTKLEEWRYTNIAPIARAPFSHAGSVPLLPAPADELDALRVVFSNGRAAELATPDPGLRLATFADAAHDPELRSLLLAHHARIAEAKDEAFANLNLALANDGVVLVISGELQRPIHLEFVSASDSGERSAAHPRVLVVARPNARAHVVQHHRSEGDGSALTNAVADLVVEDGARLEHWLVQDESAATFHIAQQFARVQRDAELRLFTATLGGRIVRNDLRVRLDEPGAACTMNGLALGRDAQLIDNHTRADHAAPRCESHEHYRTVLGGKARGVFRGRVVVRPGAQHTDATQRNANLLLSTGAEVDAKPQLEIYADDVKCSHGSSTGRLDPEALFFLRSRGFGEREARALLTEAFARELVDECGEGPVRDWLWARIEARLDGFRSDGEAS